MRILQHKTTSFSGKVFKSKERVIVLPKSKRKRMKEVNLEEVESFFSFAYEDAKQNKKKHYKEYKVVLTLFHILFTVFESDFVRLSPNLASLLSNVLKRHL